jgi:hypothetical protein
MGKQSGKRHASTGNAVPNVEANGQIEASATVNDGNGQAGADGIEASGNVDAEGEKVISGLVGLEKTRPVWEKAAAIAINDAFTFDALVNAVTAHNEECRIDLVSRAFHPKGKGENWKETDVWIGTNCADVPVLQGKASYQLSTGEIVEI